MYARMRIRSLLVLVSVGWLLCACTQLSDQTQEINIAAAASLTRVFQSLAQDFEQDTGIRIIPSFAATGQLAQQIRNGAPYDLFAAADSSHIDALIKDGFIDGQTRMTYALGELILVQAVDASTTIASMEDLMRADIRRVAIANPRHAPYGIAARQALSSSGLWSSVEHKVIYGETVQQAAVIVATGNADAGIIARSVLDPSLVAIQVVTADLYDPIEHVAAVLSNSSEPDLAWRFLEYLASARAQEILNHSGFHTP